jgi:ketosteroid isomerase-like protein
VTADEGKPDAEVAKVRAVLDAYLATAKHPDGKPLAKDAVGKDVLAFWSSGKTLTGRPALRAACDAAQAELRRDFEEFAATARDVKIRRKGDVAWLTCRLVLAGTLTEERGPFERRTRSTFVFEKRDGKWVLVHEHSSRT